MTPYQQEVAYQLSVDLHDYTYFILITCALVWSFAFLALDRWMNAHRMKRLNRGRKGVSRMICLVLIGMRDTIIQRYGGRKTPINPISLAYSEIIYLDTRTNDNVQQFEERQRQVKASTRYLERVSKSCFLAEVDCTKLPLKESYYLKGFQAD